MIRLFETERRRQSALSRASLDKWTKEKEHWLFAYSPSLLLTADILFLIVHFLILEPDSLGFPHRLKTRGSLGISQAFSARLGMLRQQAT